MIPKFPKPIYPYLGYTSEALDARITDRCPTCAPAPDGGNIDEISITEYTGVHERIIGVSMLTESLYVVGTQLEIPQTWRVNLFLINSDDTVTLVNYVEFPMTLNGLLCTKSLGFSNFGFVTLGTDYAAFVCTLYNGVSNQVYAALVSINISTGTLTAPTSYTSIGNYANGGRMAFVAGASDTTFLLVDILTADTLQTTLVTLSGGTLSGSVVENISAPDTLPPMKFNPVDTVRMAYNRDSDAWVGVVGKTDPAIPGSFYRAGFAMSNTGSLDVSVDNVLVATGDTGEYYPVYTPSTAATIFYEHNDTVGDTTLKIREVSGTLGLSLLMTDTLNSEFIGQLRPSAVYLTTETKDRIVVLRSMQRMSPPVTFDLYMDVFDPPSMTLRSRKSLGRTCKLMYATNRVKTFPDKIIGDLARAPYAYQSPQGGPMITGIMRLN